MYTIIIYSLPNKLNIIGNSWSWNNINNQLIKNQKDRWLMADTDEKHQYGCTAWQLSPNHPRPIEKTLMSILQCLSFFWWRSLKWQCCKYLFFFGGGVWRRSWSLPWLLFHRSVGPARLPQDRFSQDQFQVEKSFTRTTTLESFAFKYEKLFLIFIARKLGTADFSSSPSILSTNWCTLLKSASLSSKSRY